MKCYLILSNQYIFSSPFFVIFFFKFLNICDLLIQCISLVVSGSATIFVIGGLPLTNSTQRLSVSDKGVVSRLNNAASVPVDSVDGASAVVDDQGTITLAGGRAMLNGNTRYDLVWHLDTTDPAPDWTRGPDLVSTRRHHISFRLGNRLYVGMGRDSTYTSVSSLHMLDTKLSSPVWQKVPHDYPLKVAYAACVVIQREGVDEVWVSGGELNGVLSKAVHSWRGPGNDWQPQTNMKIARSAHSMATDGVHIWAISGKHQTTSVEFYSHNTWTIASPLPAWREFSSSVLWDDALVQIGGHGNLESWRSTETVYVMNVKSSSWSLSGASLNQAVQEYALALVTP